MKHGDIDFMLKGSSQVRRPTLATPLTPLNDMRLDPRVLCGRWAWQLRRLGRVSLCDEVLVDREDAELQGWAHNLLRSLECSRLPGLRPGRATGAYPSAAQR